MDRARREVVLMLAVAGKSRPPHLTHRALYRPRPPEPVVSEPPFEPVPFLFFFFDLLFELEPDPVLEPEPVDPLEAVEPVVPPWPDPEPCGWPARSRV